MVQMYILYGMLSFSVPKSVSFMVTLDGQNVENKLLGRPPPRLKVCHCLTLCMLGDFLTKYMQEKIIGLKNVIIIYQIV